MDLGGQILDCIVDLNIPLNELGLEELNQLHRHNQRDRHEVGEEKHPSSKPCQTLFDDGLSEVVGVSQLCGEQGEILMLGVTNSKSP